MPTGDRFWFFHTAEGHSFAGKRSGEARRNTRKMNLMQALIEGEKKQKHKAKVNAFHAMRVFLMDTRPQEGKRKHKRRRGSMRRDLRNRR